MISQTVGSKNYTLKRVDYQTAGDQESLYIEVQIIEDLPFNTRTCTYGLQLNNEETQYFMSTIGGMTEYVMAKLIEVGA